MTPNTNTCGQCGQCCIEAPCRLAVVMAELFGLDWREDSGDRCPFLLSPDAQGRRLCDVGYDYIPWCIPGASDPGMTFRPRCSLERAIGQLDLVAEERRHD